MKNEEFSNELILITLEEMLKTLKRLENSFRVIESKVENIEKIIND